MIRVRRWLLLRGSIIIILRNMRDMSLGRVRFMFIIWSVLMLKLVIKCL